MTVEAGALPCPSCDAAPVATVGALAGHLATVHGIGAGEALKRAREVESDKTLRKAGDVAERKCGSCNQPGHRANKCPTGATSAPPSAEPKRCGYCKRAGEHSDKCPKGAAKPAGRAVKAPTATTGNGHVREWLDAEIASLKGEIAYMERLRARA